MQLNQDTAVIQSRIRMLLLADPVILETRPILNCIPLWIYPNPDGILEQFIAQGGKVKKDRSVGIHTHEQVSYPKSNLHNCSWDGSGASVESNGLPAN